MRPVQFLSHRVQGSDLNLVHLRSRALLWLGSCPCAGRTTMICLLVFITTLTGSAATADAQEKDPIDVIRVNTDLVVFDAQVIDKKTKRVIGDLTKEDFELSDNGAKQQISYFSRDELPLSIILLLDVSRSVRPIIDDIRDGALNALARLKPEDQVAVMAFSLANALSAPSRI